ncbi:sporulation protein YpjB [Bacillus pumilus]|uniref:Sporulation protein YpjB n=1 Tax=Bacillus pumilus TaxID=1408 RepID=A0AAD0MLC7_BACPU|nr:sporulation protein YpjB [Bacillus pumilus]AVM24389.1 sporulation protein YpjB [Bacillus pumilus]TYS33984.1 sporulation protein YpjB [Bacillus pumilus]TYS42700.1 sporulation protein YpjB [Bacillus pumilus]TYS49036.1 sporulation protein YpjB [Bacillus pumilus]
MKRKPIAMILLFFLVLQHAAVAKAEEAADNALQELTELSDSIFQLTRQAKYDEALQVALYVEKTFKAENWRGTLTNTQVRQITLGYQDIIKGLPQEELTEREKLRYASQFRMLIDAIQSDSEPLWGSLEKPIMGSFPTLKKEVKDPESTTFYEAWNELVSLYDMIYPSLTIDVSPEKLQMIKQHMAVIEQGEFLKASSGTKLERLTKLEEDLSSVFAHVDQDEADPSLLWVILTTGSIILLTLTYVGFRKYRAEKEKKQKRQADYPKS